MFDLENRLLDAVTGTYALRMKLLADPTRPGYHFACPEDLGLPGDVNCCFYARGRYHLFYLYANRCDSFRYGHLSSIDLIHWRSHPDALMPDSLDGGIFSGGAFVDEDDTAYMAYWGLPTDSCPGGIRMAKSSDRYRKASPKNHQWQNAERSSYEAERSHCCNRCGNIH